MTKETDLICAYKNKCTADKYLCDTCRHNKSEKRDYYQPKVYIDGKTSCYLCENDHTGKYNTEGMGE